jgi:hypothetical protein
LAHKYLGIIGNTPTVTDSAGDYWPVIHLIIGAVKSEHHKEFPVCIVFVKDGAKQNCDEQSCHRAIE